MPFHAGIIFSPTVKIAKGEVIPFVEMANVRTGNSREPIDIEMRAFRGGTKFALNDTVVASIEPCLQHGKSFFVKNMERGAGSTEFMVFRGREGVTADRFVYYLMCTHEIRERMIRSMKGATGRQRVDPDVFDSIEIEIPDIRTQEKITSLLWDYDSAIDNARRQIALLEEAAMRLYREWFVVHADPKWEKRRIGDVIEFNPKVQIPKETVHEIVPMSALQVNSMILDSATIEYGIPKSGSKFTNGDTLLARITPCLENGKTAFVGNLKSSCGASGSTEFIVMRSKKLNPYMVYLIARTPDFREAAIKSMSGADGRQRAKEDVLKNIPYRLPSEGLIKKFGDVVGPMFNRAYLLQSQIESLTEARDRLLPKLMSGEIEV